MFNKLLPFSLMISLALPFIVKAGESIPTLTKQQFQFMKLVEAAVLIEAAGDIESEKSDADIKTCEQATKFLQAVKEELHKIGIIIKNSNSFLLTLQSRKLNSTIMQELEEKYINNDMRAILKHITPRTTPTDLPAILLLATMALQNQ